MTGTSRTGALHCADLGGDRDLGRYWEERFVGLALRHGFAVTPFQWERSGAAVAHAVVDGKYRTFTLPDGVIWTAPGQYHEIKHKAPTANGLYGLEEYRFSALLWLANVTRQRVFYTVHDHSLSGGRESRNNDITHWRTASIGNLNERWVRRQDGVSWIDGKRSLTPILYWRADLWVPLSHLWALDR